MTKTIPRYKNYYFANLQQIGNQPRQTRVYRTMATLKVVFSAIAVLASIQMSSASCVCRCCCDGDLYEPILFEMTYDGGFITTAVADDSADDTADAVSILPACPSYPFGCGGYCGPYVPPCRRCRYNVPTYSCLYAAAAEDDSDADDSGADDAGDDASADDASADDAGADDAGADDASAGASTAVAGNYCTGYPYGRCCGYPVRRYGGCYRKRYC